MNPSRFVLDDWQQEEKEMSYTAWFIPLCKAVSLIFTLAVLGLFIATLVFRSRVTRKYDRRKVSG
ncbi:hypothetical protein [Paenibacillus sp. TH7-28]